jgi:hypothetical protein
VVVTWEDIFEDVIVIARENGFLQILGSLLEMTRVIRKDIF